MKKERAKLIASRLVKVSAKLLEQKLQKLLTASRLFKVSAEPIAYHGSPHDFDKFETGHIGAGEGSMSYGYGTYLAEDKDEAGQYRGKKGGHLYEVEIAPSDDLFLYWYKPIGEQPKPVLKALRKIGMKDDWLTATGMVLYETLVEQMGGQRQASEFLRSIGVHGIKYLWMKDNNYHYVVFDEKDLRIKSKAIKVNAAIPMHKQKTFKTDEGKFSIYDAEKDPMKVKDRTSMFTVLEDKNGYIVRNAFIPPDLQHQGIATDFYKKTNEESWNKTGKPLRSTRARTLLTGETLTELSADGVRLWDSFVKKGYAEKLGEKDYRFFSPDIVALAEKRTPVQSRLLRAKWYRGGGDPEIIKGKTAQDMIDYEVNELGNDINIAGGIDLAKHKSENCRWVTKTRDSAKEYGDVEETHGGEILATDNYGGYLVDISGKVTASSTDAEYLAAVEAGDMAKCQQMVDQAAKAKGYNIGPVYHGTQSKGFNTFDKDFSGGQGSSFGFWFASQEQSAEKFATKRYADQTPGIVTAYLSGSFYEWGSWQEYLDSIQSIKKGSIENKYKFLKKSLQNRGYSGAIIRNSESDFAGTRDDYVVFSPAQIKSADPVTYDDSGAVIPLNKRFDSGSNDIRAKRVTAAQMIKVGRGEYGGKVIHESTREPGKIQVTTFVDRKPVGHENYDSFAEAMVDNFDDLNNEVSRQSKNFDAHAAWEEATLEHPYADELGAKKYVYVSPMRPLNGVSIDGMKSADKSGKVGVVYRDEPLTKEQVEHLSLIPFTKEAKLAYCEQLLNAGAKRVTAVHDWRYSLLGTTDEQTTCDVCGKVDLHSTMVLLDNSNLDILHCGSTCGKKLLGDKIKEYIGKANSLNKQIRQFIRDSYSNHPLLTKLSKIESDAISEVNNNPENYNISFPERRAKHKAAMQANKFWVDNNLKDHPEKKDEILADVRKATMDKYHYEFDYSDKPGWLTSDFPIRYAEGVKASRKLKAHAIANKVFATMQSKAVVDIKQQAISRMDAVIADLNKQGRELEDKVYKPNKEMVEFKGDHPYARQESYSIKQINEMKRKKKLAQLAEHLSEREEIKKYFNEYFYDLIDELKLAESRGQDIKGIINGKLSQIKGHNIRYSWDLDHPSSPVTIIYDAYIEYSKQKPDPEPEGKDKNPFFDLEDFIKQMKVSSKKTKAHAIARKIVAGIVKASEESDQAQRMQATKVWRDIYVYVSNEILQKGKGEISHRFAQTEYGMWELIFTGGLVSPATSVTFAQGGYYGGHTDGENIYIEIYDRKEDTKAYAKWLIHSPSAKQLFLHEMIHVLDKKRMKGGFGGANYVLPEEGQQEYFNQPIEYNAYYQEALASIENDLSQESEEFKNEKTKSFEAFYKYVNDTRVLKVLLEKATPDTERKILKRLYRYFKENDPVKYEKEMLGVTAATDSDAEYMAAAKAEDIEKCQAMVDAKAQAEGYTVKAYHGTNASFNTFKPQFGKAIWFSENKDKIARGEAGAQGISKIMPVYLKAQNPAGWPEYDKLLEMQIIQQGYDSVKLDDDWIIFTPQQIKSAEPIIYKNKKIVPLSERFNSNSKDIRAVKASANTLAEEAKKYDTVEQFLESRKNIHRPPDASSGSRLDNLTPSYGDDIYSRHALEYFGSGEDMIDKKALAIINRVKSKPDAMVKIYRAVGKDDVAEIGSGDWVAITKEYAREHGQGPLGNKYKIIEKDVPAKDIYGNADSLQEYGYFPEGGNDLRKDDFIKIWNEAHKQTEKVEAMKVESVSLETYQITYTDGSSEFKGITEKRAEELKLRPDVYSVVKVDNPKNTNNKLDAKYEPPVDNREKWGDRFARVVTDAILTGAVYWLGYNALKPTASTELNKEVELLHNIFSKYNKPELNLQDMSDISLRCMEAGLGISDDIIEDLYNVWYSERGEKVTAGHFFPDEAVDSGKFYPEQTDIPIDDAVNGNSDHPIVINQIVEKITIRLVDGNQIRNTLSPDFCNGGTWVTYKFIPNSEVWLDADMQQTDQLATLIHELSEIGVMNYGMEYGDAHDMVATPTEWAFRRSMPQGKTVEIELVANKIIAAMKAATKK